MIDTPDPTSPSNNNNFSADAVEETGARIADAAGKAGDTARQRAGEALQSGEQYVRTNPGTSVLSAFGLGLAMGVLIGWNIGRREEDDYATSARNFARHWVSKLNLE